MSQFRRRQFLIAAGALLAAPASSLGQQRLPRIAFLHPASPQLGEPRLLALKEGLSALGYVDGKTMHLVVRWGEGRLERLPALAEELVQLKVDLIVAATSPSVRAAGRATRTIPIVMPTSSDPVAEGLVTSLSRPGGNITGLSVMSPELGGKRLQLLKEVFPKVSRPVAVLWNPAYVGMRARLEQTQRAAPAVGLSVRSIQVQSTGDLDEAFEAIARERPDALVLLVDPFTLSQRARIAAFAAEKKLPAIYESEEFVDVGGLMSYGPNISYQFRRAAVYVDKILKGAKPGELPVEQPTKFDLVINVRAAKALGITIPPAVLLRADRLVE